MTLVALVVKMDNIDHFYQKDKVTIEFVATHHMFYINMLCYHFCNIYSEINSLHTPHLQTNKFGQF